MKTKKLLISTIAILTVMISGCAKIYTAPDAQILASNHRTLAILPPDISIAAQRNTDAEAIKEQQRTESLVVQKELQSWILRRKTQRKISAEIQDVSSTNALLAVAGYPSKTLSPGAICQLLNVNGIIRSNFSYSKPMSELGAVAVAIFTGEGANTNEVRATLNIYDCNQQKMIWSFTDRNSGSTGSTTAILIDNLIRSATRRMPYGK